MPRLSKDSTPNIQDFVYTNDGALYGGGGSRTVFAIEVRK